MDGYDYVVVGAGSAGCVMAARLTEDPDVRVLVLEAGPMDGALELEMPLASGGVFRGRYDWDFWTEPEEQLGRRCLPIPRGRVVGGSSSINGMVYTRGDAGDYDEWAALGAHGWSYEDVLPYFKRSEDNERGADRYHGVGGPLTVSDPRSRHPLTEACLEAALEAGHPANDDFNGAEQAGVGYYQLFQRDGRRCSNAKAYLHPALSRPNLTMQTETHVLRVLFEGDRAVGVETLQHGRLGRHRAEREVILAAGAVQSPHLLLLSGVGPANELAGHGIEAREDLPVGRGLQDHLCWMLSYRTERESLATAMTPGNLEAFERDGSGPLTSNIAEAGGFYRARDDADRPDVQLGFLPVLVGGRVGGPPEHGVTLAGYPTNVSARGAVTVRSADPLAKPRLVHDYVGDPDDLLRQRECLRHALQIAAQPSFRAVVTAPQLVPASASDGDLDAFIRRHGAPAFHQAGTCAIGPVVDPELRVHGLQALRVVDASVMPVVNRGNTNAPTTMIAERAADLVRGRPLAAREPVAAGS